MSHREYAGVWGRSRESRCPTIQNKKRQPFMLSFFCFWAENESLTYVRPSFWVRKSCVFLGLLLSFRVTVLAVFRVRELLYCVHIKFLCCNYLCKDNKIFWTCKMKVWDESKTDVFQLKSHYQLFSKVNIVFALTFEWESNPKIARQTLMVGRAWTGLRNLSSRVVSAALN